MDKTEFNKMINGKLYNCTDKYILRRHFRALRLAERYNKTSIYNQFWKNHLLNKLIKNKGSNCFILSDFRCEYGDNITIGDNFFSNFNCMFLDVAPIVFGNDVMFGPNCVVATPMHPLLGEDRNIKQYKDGFHDLEYAKPIKIGNSVWIASSVTICDGITIGNNVVIAAGSVVTKDIPDNSLCAGVPCKVIRFLDNEDKIDAWNAYIKEELPKSLRDQKKQ